MEDSTDIVKRNTVAEMVRAYQLAEKEVKAGYRLIFRANQRSAGGVHTELRYKDEKDVIADCLLEMKREVWKGIIDKLNVRQMMSTVKANELDAQLYGQDSRNWKHDGSIKELPEVTEENIWQTIKGLMDNLGNFQTEAIQEAFDTIRRNSEGYKSTEEGFKVGEKSVLTLMTEANYSGGLRIRYNSEQRARVIENAFRLLDGKGPAQSNKAEICEKLQAGSEGETEYYRFRAFKNGNLHVWFKRMDLVKKLNEIGAQGRKELNKVA